MYIHTHGYVFSHLSSFSPTPLRTPAISQLLYGPNSIFIVLVLCPLCVLLIFHYLQPPSESFKETVFELTAGHSVSC